jgi:hypothetical protein
MHRIIISDPARKDLKNSPLTYQSLILNKIESLLADPRPVGIKEIARI